MARVLVVDDNAENRYLLEALLTGNGHEVVTAPNGREALGLARQHPPDLVISDVLMPELDGYALCREWTKDPVLRPIPIVLYTATYTEPRDEKLAQDMGATRFLTKPMDPDELLARIADVLDETEPRRIPEPPDASAEAEVEHLTLYNERLVRKLEQKMLQLERANAELVASESRLRAVYEESPLGYHSLDGNGCLLDVNPRWLEVLGYERDEVVGRWFGDFLIEADAAAFRARLPVFLAEGQMKGVEVSARRKDGTVAVLAIDGRVEHHADGNFRRTHCVLRDVTEERRIEREQRRFEEAARHHQKLESIGTLASGVAHEINNPLNVISNYAQLLEEDPGDPAQVREAAATIVKASARMAVIVRNLLSFARHETEERRPVRLAALVDETLSLIHAVLRKDQIELACEVPADLPLIPCRAQQIQQVLMNLLTNARDAVNERYPGKSGPRAVRIVAGRFQKDGAPWVRLTVEDNGGGIAPGVAEQVFDPFFTTKPKDRGTGLGLSISYGIVKEHQGELWLENQPGVGARFHVDLKAIDGSSDLAR